MVPINTQHTEPSSWLFTTNDALLSLPNKCTAHTPYDTYIICVQTHSYMLTHAKNRFKLFAVAPLKENHWWQRLDRDFRDAYTCIPNLSLWMRSQCSVTLEIRVCDSKSEHEWRASGWGDTSPHCRFMAVYVSGSSPGDRERRSDSLAERPRFEPDLFLLFSSSPISFCTPTTSPSPVTC